jgi:hypothetical protein
VKGWSTSYPETTGYIVVTMLDYAKWRCDRSAFARAERMLDWLVSIQFADGSYQSGQIGTGQPRPVTFNTGQVLLGLARGVCDIGDKYRGAMRRAADWLVRTQDGDGCWRKFPSPLVIPGEKAYETHAAWGLLEAARADSSHSYAEAALANIQWARSLQHNNGWFEKCCLTDPSRPLTHTLGYVLRGMIEAYRFTKAPDLLAACRKTADGLLTALRADGFLPGRLLADWQTAADWACLTGTAQIALCWWILYECTGDARYRDAACAANRYLRRTIKIEGPEETRGAVSGSFPIDGDYAANQYLSWACKFFVDSNMRERACQLNNFQVSLNGRV